jgi:hypothetical protein
MVPSLLGKKKMMTAQRDNGASTKFLLLQKQQQLAVDTRLHELGADLLALGRSKLGSSKSMVVDHHHHQLHDVSGGSGTAGSGGLGASIGGRGLTPVQYTAEVAIQQALAPLGALTLHGSSDKEVLVEKYEKGGNEGGTVGLVGERTAERDADSGSPPLLVLSCGAGLASFQALPTFYRSPLEETVLKRRRSWAKRVAGSLWNALKKKNKPSQASKPPSSATRSFAGRVDLGELGAADSSAAISTMQQQKQQLEQQQKQQQKQKQKLEQESLHEDCSPILSVSVKGSTLPSSLSSPKTSAVAIGNHSFSSSPSSTFDSSSQQNLDEPREGSRKSSSRSSSSSSSSSRRRRLLPIGIGRQLESFFIVAVVSPISKVRAYFVMWVTQLLWRVRQWVKIKTGGVVAAAVGRLRLGRRNVGVERAGGGVKEAQRLVASQPRDALAVHLTPWRQALIKLQMADQLHHTLVTQQQQQSCIVSPEEEEESQSLSKNRTFGEFQSFPSSSPSALSSVVLGGVVLGKGQQQQKTVKRLESPQRKWWGRTKKESSRVDDDEVGVKKARDIDGLGSISGSDYATMAVASTTAVLDALSNHLGISLYSPPSFASSTSTSSLSPTPSLFDESLSLGSGGDARDNQRMKTRKSGVKRRLIKRVLQAAVSPIIAPLQKGRLRLASDEVETGGGVADGLPSAAVGEDEQDQEEEEKGAAETEAEVAAEFAVAVSYRRLVHCSLLASLAPASVTRRAALASKGRNDSREKNIGDYGGDEAGNVDGDNENDSIDDTNVATVTRNLPGSVAEMMLRRALGLGDDDGENKGGSGSGDDGGLLEVHTVASRKVGRWRFESIGNTHMTRVFFLSWFLLCSIDV